MFLILDLKNLYFPFFSKGIILKITIILLTFQFIFIETYSIQTTIKKKKHDNLLFGLKIIF